jgi:hypothetical protein
LPQDTIVATHIPPLGMKPALHVIPQLVPSHVAVPFVGTGHAVHEVIPQPITLVLGTHAAPHWCEPAGHTQLMPDCTKPALHVIPQLVPSHVAVPFAGTGHAVHEVIPQLLTLVFETHIPEHRCRPIGHWHAPATHVCPPMQRRPHIPQLLLSVCVSTHAGSQKVCPSVGQRHALPVHV